MSLDDLIIGIHHTTNYLTIHSSIHSSVHPTTDSTVEWWMTWLVRISAASATFKPMLYWITIKFEPGNIQFVHTSRLALMTDAYALKCGENHSRTASRLASERARNVAEEDNLLVPWLDPDFPDSEKERRLILVAEMNRKMRADAIEARLNAEHSGRGTSARYNSWCPCLSSYH